MSTSAGLAEGLVELIVPSGAKFCSPSGQSDSAEVDALDGSFFGIGLLAAVRCCMSVESRLGAELITPRLLLTRFWQITSIPPTIASFYKDQVYNITRCK